MQIGIAAIGRMKQGPEKTLVQRYLDRGRQTGKSLGLFGFTVDEQVESRAQSAKRRKFEEARLVEKKLPEKAVLVALDERGRSLDSARFAEAIGQWRDEGQPALMFLIGGADGLDADLRARAQLALSFSALTWPHQLARMLLAEQLYRATTILSGHPYHREG